MGGDTSAEVAARFETGRQLLRCLGRRRRWLLTAGSASTKSSSANWGCACRLLPGEAYIWDCVTLPAFARTTCTAPCWATSLMSCAPRPFCRVWIGADYDNLPSQRGIERAGFHPVADMVIARVLPLRQMWVQGRPGVPESLVMEARRVFLGDRDRVWLDQVRELNLRCYAGSGAGLECQRVNANCLP